jgi:hypothetical protein
MQKSEIKLSQKLKKETEKIYIKKSDNGEELRVFANLNKFEVTKTFRD